MSCLSLAKNEKNKAYVKTNPIKYYNMLNFTMSTISRLQYRYQN